MPATESETAGAAPSGSTAVVPWRSPTLLAVLAATLMTPMDVPLVSPALTEVQAAFAVSRSRAGLLLTVYALPGIALAPVVGMLADRVSRRHVLAACLALFGAAGAAVAFATDFGVALALRLVQGLAAGSVLSALAMTVVGDTYDGRRHDAVIGVTTATLSLGTALYPAVGGYLATFGWNVPFALYGLSLLVAPLVFVALPERDPGRERASGTGYVREALRTVPTGRAAALYGVMFLTYVLLFGGLYTALPFYLQDAFGLGSARTGLLTSGVLLVTAVVSLANGRASARFGTGSLVGTGFACFTVGLLGAGLAATLLPLVAALLVFGVGSGLVVPTLFGRLSALAPDHVRGGVMSLQTTTIGASQAVGPALFTLAGGAVGYRTVLLAAGSGAALGAVCLPLAATRLR